MEGDVHESERQTLMTKLLDSVKQCQIRFGGKTELATETDSRVSCLCACWESVLQHGLRHNNKALSTLKHVTQLTGLTRINSGIGLLDDIKNMETEPTFWSYAKEHMGKHDLQRYLLLKNITTDAGRGRAWLRSAINENSMEKYMHMWIERPDLISNFYEEWAFLSDAERSGMLPNMAAGLGSILFAINIDNAELNSIKPATGLDNFLIGTPPTRTFAPRPDEELRPVIASDASPKMEKKKDKRRKKKPAQIISFDDGDFSSYSASPASTVTSPRSMTFDMSSIPVINAGTSSTARSFKEGGSGNLSFDEDQPGPSKGHIRTGSCDSPLQYYNSQYKPGDTPLRNSSSHRSVHFGDIPETRSSPMCSPTRDDDKDPTGVQYLQSSSVVSNDSGLEDDEKVKESVEPIPNEQTSIPTSESIVSSHDEKVASSSQSTVPCDVFPTTAQSSVYSADQTVSMTYAQAKQTMGFVTSPPLQRVARTLLADIGRTDSETSNISAASDQSSSAVGSVAEMTPVPPPDQAPSQAITIVCSSRGPQEDSTSDSYDSSEVSLHNEMAKHTAKAMALAQLGMSDSLRTQGDGSHAPDPILTQDSMTTAELKQAVIAMMGRKDEVEEQNKALTSALEHELSTSSSLRLEIEEMRREHKLRIDKDAERVTALTRENDVLKQQLKKYINAVQMLKRQGAKSEELSGLPITDVQPEASSQKQLASNQEASEYEKKLVQVAEMHAELMEFNELLQKQLVGRESLIKSLREELTSLRGPLPDHQQELDNKFDLVADGSSGSLRPLINIWVPSAFLRGSGNDGHHVYQVYVRIGDDEWNVYRRYTDFHNFHATLKKRFPIIATYQFPPKKAIGSKEPKLVEKRRKDLQAYLRRVVNLLILGNPDLATTASKETLIKTLPFFGDQPEKSDKKKSGKREQGKKDRASQRASSDQTGTSGVSQQRPHVGS